MSHAFGTTTASKSSRHHTAGTLYNTHPVRIAHRRPNVHSLTKNVISMLLTLIRKPTTKHYTEGELFLGEKKLCDTLEDRVREIRSPRDKIAGYTAIPAGKYRVLWTYSNKFKRYTPELQQVPWFTAIRIHAGNTPADTGGCILVGQKERDGHLILSRITTERIYSLISSAILKQELVYISIS